MERVGIVGFVVYQALGLAEAQWTGPSSVCGQVGDAPDGINSNLDPT